MNDSLPPGTLTAAMAVPILLTSQSLTAFLVYIHRSSSARPAQLQHPDRRISVLKSHITLCACVTQPAPLTQIAKIEFGFEPGVMWREGRQYAITVQGDVVEGVQGRP